MAGVISEDFAARKRKILAQLAVPDAEYTDASPKGTVDAGIRDLIDELNGLDGFVTTSSCGGRVSVFVEGVKKRSPARAQDADNGMAKGDEEGIEGNDDDAAAARPAGTATLAAIGGKGGGGNWLFVSHDPVVIADSKGHERDLKDVLGLKNSHEAGEDDGSPLREDSSSMISSRLIHFKFEPMVSKYLAHVHDGQPQSGEGASGLSPFLSGYRRSRSSWSFLVRGVHADQELDTSRPYRITSARPTPPTLRSPSRVPRERCHQSDRKRRAGRGGDGTHAHGSDPVHGSDL